MRIGILTSGGDCPGLNAVIRGAVLKGTEINGQEFVGFKDGWRGVVNGDVIPLERSDVRGIAKQGGTILGTSRTNPFEGNGGPERIQETLDRLGIDAIMAIGGEGTLAAAKRLTDAGLRIVGVPKTVDNDLDATDYTFGFDTAVEIATEAMDRLRTTGDSHSRCMVAEVMGRHVGWIALHSGMAAGAHAILIPEQKTSMAQVAEWVQSAADRGRAPLVVVAEGFTPDHADDPHSERGLDAFGRPRLGGIGERLAPMIEDLTGIETRATTLGHIQRGGVPTAYDRVLATRLGMAASDIVQDGSWGHTLKRIYGERDLLVAECMRRQVWHDLDPAALAAIACALVYEPRREEPEGYERNLPRGAFRIALEKTQELWAQIDDIQVDHKLPGSTPVATGLSGAMHRWARGGSLDDVLTDADMAAGDFVRWSKQTIDLLDQLQGTPDARLAVTARAAIDAVRRGIVAYSSVA